MGVVTERQLGSRKPNKNLRGARMDTLGTHHIFDIYLFSIRFIRQWIDCNLPSTFCALEINDGTNRVHGKELL